MKKKKIDFRIVLILLLLIILVGMIVLYCNDFSWLDTSSDGDSTTNETTITQETVQVRTILKTIDSTGEIQTAMSEKISLHATYYFAELLVQENQLVKQGEKIIAYTNGTYLTAPYNCIVTNTNLPAENKQCTNEHYLQLQATSTLTINAKVEEENLNEVQIGQEAKIEISASENKTYTGYVTKIGSTASNGSFEITVEFANDGNIKIGMTGSCQIILDKAENVIAVPTEAVTTSKGSSYVTVVENGNEEQRSVETGISNNAYIEIKSGLTEGETVQIEKSTSSNTTNGMNNFNQKMMEGIPPERNKID